LETVSKCISSIVVGEEVYNSSDMTEAEVTEWLEGMTTEQFKKLMTFFETMPQLKHEIKVKNTNTGKDFTITLQGLADFF
jgi:ribosome-associated translation inhibitor RaiA